MTSATAPIEHILLGVDDGDYSWESVPVGQAVAASVGAQFHVFHATDDKVPDAISARALGAEVDLHSAVGRHGSDGVAHTMVRHVAELDNAVIALTSHARRGITANILGSTARSALEATHDPILLFGPHLETDGEIARVMACIDGSELSESILPVACRWARAAQVPLWLAHVVEPAVSATAGSADSNYVHRVMEDIETDDLDVEFDVLHGDHPGRSIAEYADDHPGTLTALATHGRSGLREMTMGSVAMEVTRRAQGPTLVMRPAQDASG